MTPALASAVPQVFALARNVATPYVPCTRAVGIVPNPGPWRTWTLPPSWSVATSSPTLSVVVVVTRAWKYFVRVADRGDAGVAAAGEEEATHVIGPDR